MESHIAIRQFKDTADDADTGHEGSQLSQEAMRWVQERAEEEGQICIHNLQQRPKAQAEVCRYCLHGGQELIANARVGKDDV
jgi:hypothetical protein